MSVQTTKIKNAAGGATNTIRPLTPHLSKQKAGLVMNVQETWLPVVGWEDLYEVSDQGRVRSLDREIEMSSSRTRAFKMVKRGRVLSPIFSAGYSYPRVQLCRDGVVARRRVHRLVAEAFLGPRPDGMYVCHWNDDPTDNRLANLRYATPSQNSYDAVRNGRNWEANMTHCKYGHAFTDENTYINPSTGARRCYTCKRQRR